MAVPNGSLLTVRGFLAEGDAQLQKRVNGEPGTLRKDPKRKAASNELYGVCNEN